ncbi:MAG: carboxylating nicotinate-nucleotide diphosphorylase [Thermoplasmata archaeon]|nr:MAG: carboxylating nicotinate-nucleotide diphosphorylase [Thermoplasmata archaeon]
MDVAYYLAEDIMDSDITSEALLSDEKAKGQIIAKEDCVIAGLLEAQEIFSYLGLDVKSEVSDGDRAIMGDIVLTIKGNAKDILAGERLALNFLGRMSGIATETGKLVEKCRKINSNVQIAATRKTTPGFRIFEKKAVELGGGFPHRMRLDDAFLIKDNHLKLLSGIEEAVKRAKTSEYARSGEKVEIEVESQEDAKRAVLAGADIVMLDNMSPKEAEDAFLMIKKANPDVIVEISGGITPENIEKYAVYADIISLGYLTHSIVAKDFSLEIIDVLDAN